MRTCNRRRPTQLSFSGPVQLCYKISELWTQRKQKYAGLAYGSPTLSLHLSDRPTVPHTVPYIKFCWKLKCLLPGFLKWSCDSNKTWKNCLGLGSGTSRIASLTAKPPGWGDLSRELSRWMVIEWKHENDVMPNQPTFVAMAPTTCLLYCTCCIENGDNKRTSLWRILFWECSA